MKLVIILAFIFYTVSSASIAEKNNSDLDREKRLLGAMVGKLFSAAHSTGKMAFTTACKAMSLGLSGGCAATLNPVGDSVGSIACSGLGALTMGFGAPPCLMVKQITKTYCSTAGNSIGGTGKSLHEYVCDKLSEQLDKTDGLVNSISNAIGGGVNAAQNVAGQAIQGAQNVAGQAIQGAQNAGGQAIQGAQNMAGQAVQGAQNVAGQAIQGAQNAGGQAIQGAQNVAGQAVQGAQNTAQAAGQAVGNPLAGGVAMGVNGGDDDKKDDGGGYFSRMKNFFGKKRSVIERRSPQ